MNPESPRTPREEMETWLTALLLDELSEGEAAAVRELIKHDPELAKLHEQLARTIVLVRDAETDKTAGPTSESLKLSEERRQRLIASFAIPPLKPEHSENQPRMPIRLVTVLAVIAVVAASSVTFMISSQSQRGGLPNNYEAMSDLSASVATAERELLGRIASVSGASSPITNYNHYSSTPRPAMKAPTRVTPLPDAMPATPALSDLSTVHQTPQKPQTTTIVLPELNSDAAGVVIADFDGRESKEGTKLGFQTWGLDSPRGGTSAETAQRFYRFENGGGENRSTSSDWFGSGAVAGGKSPASDPAIQSSSGLAIAGDDISGKTERGVQTTGGRDTLYTFSPGAGGISGGGAMPATPPAQVPALATATGPEAEIFARRYALSAGYVVTNSLALSESRRLSEVQLGRRLEMGRESLAAAPRNKGELFKDGVAVAGKSETVSSSTKIDVLQRYRELTGKQILAPSDLGAQRLWLQTDKPLSKDAEINAIEAGLALNGVAMVHVDDKFVKAVPQSPAAQEGAPLSEQSPRIQVSGQIAASDAKVRELQAQVDQLRGSLAVLELDAASPAPTPLMEAESLRNLERHRIETEVALISGEKQLEKLKALSREELREVLPRTVPDANLTERITQLDLASQQLVRLKKDYGADDPDVAKLQAQVDELNKKIEASVDGALSALETSVVMAKAKVPLLQKAVEDAKKQDLQKAEKNRQYYAKKQELEQAVQQRDVLRRQLTEREPDVPTIRKPSTNAPIPQPEIQTSENNFSTFSLNVSDVSFKLAMASLEKGQMPDAASVRSEEFINAFDYRDAEPAAGVPIAFAWERARYPFAHNRDLLRFSLKTAAAGRVNGHPLNIVLLLDNSGSMERADRVRIIREALRVLAGQLQPQDKLSVITFARTPRLVADGISGDRAGEVTEAVAGLTPQGGTNLEDAMNLAYQTAAKHYLMNGINRVVMLTDGAANLGDVEPDSLKQKVEAQRKQGIALDCFGIGWDGFNDDLLEVLSRNGDGRYGFINSPEEAATDFVGQLAGALKVAASDVKVQVEFNPRRVTTFRQIGYAKHQLTKEQFRDNTVDAAEIAAQEAGNALYTVEVNSAGDGPLCTVRVRYKIPGTTTYREQAWDVPYTGNALSLEQSSPAMRLATSASAFSEWLGTSPFAGEVAPDKLLNLIRGVPEVFGADSRPKKLEWMIRQAKSLEGK